MKNDGQDVVASLKSRWTETKMGTMSGSGSVASSSRPLSLDEYERYGRQMIMPGFGLPGMSTLVQIKCRGTRGDSNEDAS